MQHLSLNKPTRLFLFLAGFFITNTIVAEFIGIKIFSLEQTLGIADVHWSLLGMKGTLQFTAGVLLWPVVFITTDIINEYFGRKGVRLITLLTVGLIIYAFVMVWLAVGLHPADWWLTQYKIAGIDDLQVAFKAIYLQSNWIIVGSMIAFLLGQLLDAFIFYRIKRQYGGKLWLRALVSTIVSQCIDSYIVLYVAFVVGPQRWPIHQFLAIGTVNFGYKVLMAILLLPVLYIAHIAVERYLGAANAHKLRAEALGLEK